MTNIENEVVSMDFDGRRFATGVTGTLSMLDKLKSALSFGGASKGVTDLQKSVSGFNMGPMGGAIDGISKKFLAMSTIAITALANIVNRAVDAGARVASSFTIDPLRTGFQEYETNIKSIQTILANTSQAGTTLKDVNKALDELNTYSDQTIYNFSQMAKNIGTFTRAGVDLDTATASIKGIANAAALAGADSDDAARAMYQLSQAISSGRVGLQDWNSVENAGLGSATFKRMLAETAVAMGTLNDEAVKLEGPMKNVKIQGSSFRDSIMAKPGEQSWLTSKVLTNTLQQFTGDLSKAEIMAQGFTDAQAEAIMKTAKLAKASATEVKTLSGVFDVAREMTASGWAKTWQLIFGDFKEAKNLFTGLSTFVGDMISDSSKARNAVIKDWKEMGGREVAIKGLQAAFKALKGVLVPIQNAFRDIFPPATGKTLLDLTKGFRDLMQSLRPSAETMENIRRTARGFFAAFDIGWEIFKGLVGVVKDVFAAVGGGQGGFLNFTGTVGDFVVKIHDLLIEGGLLAAFFEGLTDVLKPVARFVGTVAGAIGSLFTGFDPKTSKAVTDTFDKISSRMSGVEQTAERVRSVIKKVRDFLVGIGQEIGEFFGGLGDAIAGAITPENFGSALDAINTGLLAGLVLLIRKFMSDGLSFDFTGGLFESVKGTLGEVQGALVSLQASVKADTILKIAAALAILTASIVVLSMIDPKKLATALAGISIGLIGFNVSLATMASTISMWGALKLPFIAASLVPLAAALLLLSFALKNLAELNYQELQRGLFGVGSLLAMLVIASKPLSKNSAGMITAGVGITAMAVGLKIMASVVKDFAEMSWGEMIKGLVGVAGALAAVTAAMTLMPKNIAMQAVGIFIVAGALKVLGSAVKQFAELDYKTIARGLIGIGGALGVIAAAMHLMPKNMVAQAAALVIVGAALHIVQSAIRKMGEMDTQTIGVGLLTLAASLGILAAGLYLMSGTGLGALALLAAAAALTVFLPVLQGLGAMSWEAIAKGLVAMAGAFTVLGVAGFVLAPLTPVILGLGLAIGLFGAGIALAGAGVLAFASAFALFVGAVTVGGAAVVTFVTTMIALLPSAMVAIGEGVVGFAKAISKGGPEFVKAFVAVFGAMLDAGIKLFPKFRKFIQELVSMLIGLLLDNVPRLAEAGLKLLIGILEGISSNIQRITELAVEILAEFIRGLGKGADDLAQAGAEMIIDLVNAISLAIQNNSEEMGRAGSNLGIAIISGIIKGIWGGMQAVKDAAESVAKSALNAAKEFLGIASPSKEFEKLGRYVDEGFAKGLKGSESLITNTMADMMERLKTQSKAIADEIGVTQEKLKELKKADDPNEKAIAKAKKRLDELKKLQDAYSGAHDKFKNDLLAERNSLRALGKEYDARVKELEDARQALQAAIDVRDSYESQIAGQYGRPPQIEEDDTYESYIEKLNAEKAKVDKFHASLQQLRAMGLDDAAYQQLLEQGFGAQPMIDSLIAGGPAAVEAIDAATASLTQSAAALAASASKELYQAGVDSAAGLVQGLEASISTLEDTMDKLGKKLIKALKKALGIKSPSKAFEEVGKFSDQGLASGLKKYSGVVEKASAAVGDKALDTLRVSMNKVGDIVPKNVEMNPTITPILDLTRLERDASAIGSMLTVPPIDTSFARQQVASISEAVEAARARTDASSEPRQVILDLDQTNISPDPLDDIQIYRNTKSLFAQAKEALE